MKLFEHYEKVANHIISNLDEKVFMQGEVIERKPPYYIVDIYGLGKERNKTCPSYINGNKVMCFGANRGLTHKLVSDAVEKLSGTRADDIALENVEWTGSITKYEDDLFAGVVTFNTRR